MGFRMQEGRGWRFAVRVWVRLCLALLVPGLQSIWGFGMRLGFQPVGFRI